MAVNSVNFIGNKSFGFNNISQKGVEWNISVGISFYIVSIDGWPFMVPFLPCVTVDSPLMISKKIICLYLNSTVRDRTVNLIASAGTHILTQWKIDSWLLTGPGVSIHTQRPKLWSTALFMICNCYTQQVLSCSCSLTHQAVLFVSCSHTCDPLRWLCRRDRQCGAARSGLRKAGHPSRKLVSGASCNGADRRTPPLRD